VTAVEQLLTLAAGVGPDAVDAVARIRDRTGTHHAAFEWTDGDRAAAAFAAVHDASRGGELSCWRYIQPKASLSETRAQAWRVAVIGEDLALVGKARRACRAHAGVPVDLEDELLARLRARRMESLCDALLAEWRRAGTVPRTGAIRQRARYGTGAVLLPDGTMAPYHRPQG
jgi:hypothetical protein